MAGGGSVGMTMGGRTEIEAAGRRWAAAAVVAVAVALIGWRLLAGLDRVELVHSAAPVFLASLIAGLAIGATGVGGGAVLVPMLVFLGDAGLVTVWFGRELDSAIVLIAFAHAVAAIAALGRLAGDTWSGAEGEGRSVSLDDVRSLALAGLATAVPGAVVTAAGLALDMRVQETLFEIAMLGCGVALFVFALAFRGSEGHRDRPRRLDLWWMIGLGAVAGPLAPLIAIGFGEWAAIALIARRYRTERALAAVIVAGAGAYAAAALVRGVIGAVDWEIVVAGLPGVLVGGAVGPFVAGRLGTMRLTLTIALWTVGLGVAMIIRALG